jgi:hypothetical protein
MNYRNILTTSLLVLAGCKPAQHDITYHHRAGYHTLFLSSGDRLNLLDVNHDGTKEVVNLIASGFPCWSVPGTPYWSEKCYLLTPKAQKLATQIGKLEEKLISELALQQQAPTNP